MPQVQVIQRQQDPMVGIIQQGTAGVLDALKQSQAMSLAAKELKIKSVQAKNEMDKIKFDKASKLAEEFGKIKEQGGSPEAISANLSLLADGYFDGDKSAMMASMGLAGQTLEKFSKLLSGSPGTQAGYRQAQAEQLAASTTQGERELALKEEAAPLELEKLKSEVEENLASAGKSRAFSNLLRGMPNGAAGGAGGVGGATQGARDIVLTGVTGAGPRFESLSGTRQVAEQKALGSAAGTMEKELAPAREIQKQYTNIIDAAEVEMGGFGAVPASAVMRGGIQAIKSQFVEDMPNVDAFLKLQKPLTLRWARVFNGGRPSDQDFEYVKPGLESIFNMKPTNRILRSFWNTALSNPLMHADPNATQAENNANFRSLADQAIRLRDMDLELVEWAESQGYAPDQIEQLLEEAHNKDPRYGF